MTGLEPTECHMSGEELNGCMGAVHWVPCAMCGEAAGAAPALTLAPKCRAFSCSSGGERDGGEAGKEGACVVEAPK